MRGELDSAVRDLLESATEVHVRYTRKAERGEETGLYAPAFERLRSSLLNLKKLGYLADEWRMEDS